MLFLCCDALEILTGNPRKKQRYVESHTTDLRIIETRANEVFNNARKIYHHKSVLGFRDTSLTILVWPLYKCVQMLVSLCLPCD